MKYVAPSLGAGSFTCPFCGVLAQQQWRSSDESFSRTNTSFKVGVTVHTCRCVNCKKWSLWKGDQMVSPSRGVAPPPNTDLSEEILRDYEEAASISSLSPRGAAALLRLALQKLLNELEKNAKDLNDAIRKLVKKGLPIKVQKALDSVRVIGNNAVHPGQIDVDDTNVAANLFFLINIIVESAVTVPGKVDQIYDSLPDTAKAAIEERDSD